MYKKLKYIFIFSLYYASGSSSSSQMQDLIKNLSVLLNSNAYRTKSPEEGICEPPKGLDEAMFIDVNTKDEYSIKCSEEGICEALKGLDEAMLIDGNIKDDRLIDLLKQILESHEIEIDSPLSHLLARIIDDIKEENYKLRSIVGLFFTHGDLNSDFFTNDPLRQKKLKYYVKHLFLMHDAQIRSQKANIWRCADDDLKARLQDGDSKIRNLQQRFNHLQEENNKLKNKNDLLEKLHQSEKNTINLLIKQLQDLEAKLKGSNAEIQNLQQMINRYEADMIILRRENKAVQNVVSAKIRELFQRDLPKSHRFDLNLMFPEKF